jgi:hypothetical protein
MPLPQAKISIAVRIEYARSKRGIAITRSMGSRLMPMATRPHQPMHKTEAMKAQSYAAKCVPDPDILGWPVVAQVAPTLRDTAPTCRLIPVARWRVFIVSLVGLTERLSRNRFTVPSTENSALV